MTEFNGAEVVVGLPAEIALASTSRYHYRVNKSTSNMLACCPSVRCEKGSLVDGARPAPPFGHKIMKPIHRDATYSDEVRFIDLVSALASHYANLYPPSRLVVIHIDRWFGRKWLRFMGILCGRVGAHTDVPHPDRTN